MNIPSASNIDNVIIGLECGIDREYPIMKAFSDHSNPVYQAKLWGKEPPQQVAYVKPHKRLRYIAMLPVTALGGNDSALVEAIYNSVNKLTIPWGCWNRDMDSTYLVKNGYDHNGVMRFIRIPHVLSRECKHSKEDPSDQACVGCKNLWNVKPVTLRTSDDE
jgi:hypothetical protein